jgi:hypothetical protein
MHPFSVIRQYSVPNKVRAYGLTGFRPWAGLAWMGFGEVYWDFKSEVIFWYTTKMKDVLVLCLLTDLISL